MIENAPKIRIAPSFRRPTPAQIAGLRDVPTGFVVDALGGGNTMDYRVKPVIAEQGILYGVAITCDAGPADNLAVFASLKHLEPGDVIVGYNGKPIRNRDELVSMVTATRPGTTVPMRIVRDRQEQTISITVEELDLETEAAALRADNRGGASPEQETSSGLSKPEIRLPTSGSLAR